MQLIPVEHFDGIRLLDITTNTTNTGRVQVRYFGAYPRIPFNDWYDLCGNSDQWNNKHASYICKLLGYSGGEALVYDQSLLSTPHIAYVSCSDGKVQCHP